jgi:Flp pilus assembly protein TadD
MAVAAAAAALASAGIATAQQSPTTTAPTTTAPATTTPAAAPVLRNLKLPATVSARQGHARFLVGVRLSAPARVTVQVTAVTGNLLVKTVSSATPEKAGRVYFLIEATNQQRFQLPAGRYRVRVQATDSRSRVSRPLQKVVTLALTTPRARLDAYTVALWPSLARSLGVPGGGGQLVAAVAPRGVAARAGLRRGDVITAVGGTEVTTPGSWQVALRALKADARTELTVRRGTATSTVAITPKPDWNAVPDLTRTLQVVVRRNPRSLAYAVAQARYLVEQGKTDVAAGLIARWPRTWRTGAAGEAVQAQLQERSSQSKRALAAWNRALRKDPKMAEASFGRGVALTALGKDVQAAAAFGAARLADPRDPASAAFQAFSLLRGGATAEALPPAREAVKLDADYADAKVAEGIALISNKQRAAGVVALRQGLLLTDDPSRAQTLIDQYLEPNDR